MCLFLWRKYKIFLNELGDPHAAPSDCTPPLILRVDTTALRTVPRSTCVLLLVCDAFCACTLLPLMSDINPKGTSMLLTPPELAIIILEKNPDVVAKVASNANLIKALYWKICDKLEIAVGTDASKAQETLRLIGIPTHGLDLDF